MEKIAAELAKLRKLLTETAELQRGRAGKD
jgi:hypothetical protein